MQHLATHRISSSLNSARKCAGDFSFGNLPPRHCSARHFTTRLASPQCNSTICLCQRTTARHMAAHLASSRLTATQRYFGTTRLASLLRGSMHLGTSRLNSTQRFVCVSASRHSASLHRTAHHFSTQHNATILWNIAPLHVSTLLHTPRLNSTQLIATIVLLRRTTSQHDTPRLPAAPRTSARRNATICLDTSLHVASLLISTRLSTTQRY